MKISIIMICYNPVLEKAIRTIASIIRQDNAEFELIICDDGSKVDYLEEMEDFLKKQKFHAYKIVKNIENKGTIKNIVSGLKVATGEYAILISPGDYLYNRDTLKMTSQYICDNHAEIVFGDFVPYSEKDNQYIFYSSSYNPKHKESYIEGIDYDYDMINQYIWQDLDRICGATLCYKIDLLWKYLEILSGHGVVLLEDLAINLAALDKVRIWRMPIYVRWYECNTGVSAGYNSYKSRVNIDWRNFSNYILDSCDNEIECKGASMMLRRLKIKRRWEHGFFKIFFLLWNQMVNHRERRVLKKGEYNFKLDFFNEIVG